jgi:hypothetical protein
MRHAAPVLALIFLAALPPAHADQARAGKCAASLQPEALLVFNAVQSAPQPQRALKSVLEARVRELVFMDRLPMRSARPAAEAASECLRIARNCTGNVC